ncbi:MAG: hypothetical protein KBH99_05825 [Syntrophobacteraceae bacterium]|nr:hypothetical protein [Syntrophobacteraceae bacterium]
MNTHVDFRRLKQEIRRNCEISDAGHAGLFSICGLLLRLRDLYKWEHSIPPWEEPEPADLMEWIEATETRWEEVLHHPWVLLTLGDETFHPFETASVNIRLGPRGLIYGAGYAVGMKPSFFLGEVLETRRLGGLKIHVVGKEWVRDLYAAPAMRQGEQIFARRTPMLFFLWDQLLEMRPSAREPLSYAFSRYGLDSESIRRRPREWGPKLESVAASELETWIYHEVGEATDTTFTNLQWQEIVSTYSNSPVEIFTRVIKDLLADTHPQGLLSHIIQHEIHSSLGFYLSFMRPFTRVLFPEIVPAFRDFISSGDWSGIERAREAAYDKARRNGLELIRLHESGKDQDSRRNQERIVSRLIEPLGVLGTLTSLNDST